MVWNRFGLALVMALSLLVIAVIRIPSPGWEKPSALFSTLWIGFALLVIAANWRRVLTESEVKKRKDEQARRKRWLHTQSESSRRPLRKASGR